MVFIGGPRQVGKTTFACELLGNSKNGYLNWDISENRESILKRELPNSKFWVFDEIHKYRKWRNYIKGLYDKKIPDQKILVTGSARLDYYRFGGDSLQGRYHYLRLFPLSVAELKIVTENDLNELLELGCFPEPFFSSSKIESKRWAREYRTRVIQEDIRTLEKISDITNIELLMIKLPEMVGSPLSINSIREDLQVSHKAVSDWINILERLYVIFRLPPFGTSRIRAVKKEQKHYHFDYTLVSDQALRFENLVALNLLKWVSYIEDTQGEDIELRYFRDIDGREVDFVIVKNKKPVTFIEVKWNDTEIGKGLKYLKQRFPECEAYQISAVGKKEYINQDGIIVLPAVKYLSKLI